LDDAVIVTRNEDGKIKLKQSVNLVSSGAWNGAFWGGLIGMIFTGPLGLVVVGGLGAGFGALTGSLADYGINDNFIKQLSEDMKPCCSGLFILVRSMTQDKVLEELQGVGGKVITTSLPSDVEDKLRTAIQKSDTAESIQK